MHTSSVRMCTQAVLDIPTGACHSEGLDKSHGTQSPMLLIRAKLIRLKIIGKID